MEPGTARLLDGLPALWPFRTAGQVRAWRRAQRAAGADPGHRLDPGLTALEFTRGVLGFTTVDRVTSVQAVLTSPASALVGVGWAEPGGGVRTVATLRLVRAPAGEGGEGGGDGTGDDADDDLAPWVVTGTADAATAFTGPRPGDAVTAPLLVEGRLTGVDEALRVLVVGPDGRTLGAAGPIGLGGVDQPWSVRVPLQPAPSGSLLTVAVRTGGHVGDVEWFAVTGAYLA